MTQHVGYLLDRAAAAHQATGQGVAQRMGTPMRNARAAECAAHHAADGGRTDRLIVRGEMPNEYGTVAACRSLVADVVLQRLASGLQQRQHVLAPRLRALERDGAALPVDVVEPQTIDLGRAQAQVERQANDRVAAPG